MIPLIAPTHYFKLSNGQIIKHLDELPEAIEQMDETLFRDYVDESKNDFAKWIYDVFRLAELSSLLGNVKSKKESARIIRAYLHQKKNSTKKEKEIVFRNSQETVKLNSQENAPAEEKNSEQKLNKNKFTWKKENNPENQPSTDVNTVMKQEKVQSNATEENITDADKYFDENPVLVSQMVEHKKKDLNLEKLGKISFSEKENSKDILELFKDTYAKAYEKIVFLRKNGFDTKIVELMLFRIPSRIKLYEASEDKKEAIQIQRYLNEVIEELNGIHE